MEREQLQAVRIRRGRCCARCALVIRCGRLGRLPGEFQRERVKGSGCELRRSWARSGPLVRSWARGCRSDRSGALGAAAGSWGSSWWSGSSCGPVRIRRGRDPRPCVSGVLRVRVLQAGGRVLLCAPKIPAVIFSGACAQTSPPSCKLPTLRRVERGGDSHSSRNSCSSMLAAAAGFISLRSSTVLSNAS